MSGTSLDGLDIALCKISGSGRETAVSLEYFTTVSYPEKVKNKLRQIVSVPDVSLQDVCLHHSWLGNYHGELILDTLSDWNIAPAEIDCIASHGQTIYHAPKSQHGKTDMPNATLQIGDADHIAHTTGILTIGDFRQKHTAADGEGAPLAALVDKLLYTHDTENRVLLNIGGIANFTFLPARSANQESTITTDTGPGNTLIDQAASIYFDEDFDRDGKIASSGNVRDNVLQILKSNPYFQRSLPKTTGPEYFNLDWVHERIGDKNSEQINPADLIATLTQLSAQTIADSIKNVTGNRGDSTVYISGGGLHNPTLMKAIRQALPKYEIHPFGAIGFNPDAKEAAIFAVLANEMLSGGGFNINDKSEHQINLGKISFPD